MAAPATDATPSLGFGHRPDMPLPDYLSSLGARWRRVDEFYERLDVAARQADKYRAKGIRMITMRGMKGDVECYALYERVFNE